VQLPVERVSRHHALIRHQAGEWWLEDEQSMHGTRLNATQVLEPAHLQAGDRIYIEGFVIVFQDDHVPPQDLEEAVTRGDE
jgi:pSer/pThr/pTyr-binding forkhead associated (FHA) protein